MFEPFANVLAANAPALQNVHTPFPMGMHLVFCIAATVVYGLQYISKKSLHYMCLLLACDLTFVVQLNTSDVTIGVLFVLEALLLIGAAVFSHKYNKKLKAEEGESKKPAENNDSVDNAFED